MAACQFPPGPITCSSHPLGIPSAIVICRACVCQKLLCLHSKMLTLRRGGNLKREEACMLEGYHFFSAIGDEHTMPMVHLA